MEKIPQQINQQEIRHNLVQETKDAIHASKTEIKALNETLDPLPYPFEWIQWYLENNFEDFQNNIPTLIQNREEFNALDENLQELLSWNTNKIYETIQEAESYGVAIASPQTRQEFNAWFTELDEVESPNKTFSISQYWDKVPYKNVALLQSFGLSPLQAKDRALLTKNKDLIMTFCEFDTNKRSEIQRAFLLDFLAKHSIDTYEEMIALMSNRAFINTYEKISFAGKDIHAFLRDLMAEDFTAQPSQTARVISEELIPYTKDRFIGSDSDILEQLYASYYSPRVTPEMWNTVQQIIAEQKNSIKLHDINFLLWAAQNHDIMDLYKNPDKRKKAMQVFNTIAPSERLARPSENDPYREKNKQRLRLFEEHKTFFVRMQNLYGDYVETDNKAEKRSIMQTIRKEKRDFFRQYPEFRTNRQDLFYRVLTLDEKSRIEKQEDIDAYNARNNYIYEYCERPEVEALSDIKQVEILTLHQALQAPETQKRIGAIIWQDINEVPDSELGGHIEFRRGPNGYELNLRASETYKTNDYNGSYEIDPANDRYTPKAHLSFHLHATSENERGYTGPSWDVYGNGTFSSGDLGGLSDHQSDVVISTMGHPTDENGNEITDQIQVNLDMYWKENGEVFIFDMGVITVPFQKRE